MLCLQICKTYNFNWRKDVVVEISWNQNMALSMVSGLSSLLVNQRAGQIRIRIISLTKCTQSTWTSNRLTSGAESVSDHPVLLVRAFQITSINREFQLILFTDTVRTARGNAIHPPTLKIQIREIEVQTGEIKQPNYGTRLVEETMTSPSRMKI